MNRIRPWKLLQTAYQGIWALPKAVGTSRNLNAAQTEITHRVGIPVKSQNNGPET
jgi:hypothetical protein